MLIYKDSRAKPHDLGEVSALPRALLGETQRQEVFLPSAHVAVAAYF